MRRFGSLFLFVLLLGVAAGLASAQSSVDVNVGLGAAQATAGPGFDTTTFMNCTATTTSCAKTPSLNSFFMGLGANLMLWEHLGFGGEANFQPVKQTFATLGSTGLGSTEKLQTRVTFYDFNAIFRPVNTPRANLLLAGGIGGANVRFYDSISGSGSVLGSTNSSQFFSSSNHYQMHAGAGVQLYLTDKVFIRPQFDFRYVPNFVQFGRNTVTQGSVWIGYSLGERQ